MATIADLKRAVARTKSRQSSVFLQTKAADVPSGFKSFGAVRDASFEAEGVNAPRDQDGREQTLAWDITVTFTLSQTSDVELSLLGNLARPDEADYPNGFLIFFSDGKASIADIEDDVTAGELATGVKGLGFKNVLLKPSPSIKLNGDGDSGIVIEFTGRLEIDDLDNFDNDPVIVVSPD